MTTLQNFAIVLFAIQLMFPAAANAIDRSLEVEIYLDGKLVFQGGTSDDGTLTGDSIWLNYAFSCDSDYFAPGLQKKRDIDKDNFIEIQGSKNLFKLVAERDKKDLPRISLRIDSAGLVMVDELTLLKIENPRLSKTTIWQLRRDELEKLFSIRQVPRSAIGDLESQPASDAKEKILKEWQSMVNQIKANRATQQKSND